jgi:hypothetical protein
MGFALTVFRKIIPKDVDCSILAVAGPSLVFCTLFVGLQREANIDLAIFALFGTLFCAKARMHGLVCTTIFFATVSTIKHIFFVESHLWQLGVEGAMMMGFGVIAATFDLLQTAKETASVRQENQQKAIHYLEENLTASQQEALKEQLLQQGRISSLQKDLDEQAGELHSIRVLNDVIRKTAAKTLVEREDFARQLIDKEKELKACQKGNSELRSACARLQAEIEQQADQIALREKAFDAMEDRLKAADRSESLLREIKKQFGEKNNVLQQTRLKLFHADTALQAIEMDLEQQKMVEPSFAEDKLYQELAELNEQCISLESENKDLTDVIRCLTQEQLGLVHHNQFP